MRLAARADWLECKEICLPGKADVEITLPVEASARPSGDAAHFAKTRALMPGDGSAWKPRALSVPKRLVLAFAPQAAPSEAYFFVDEPQVIEYAEPQKLLRTADGFALELAP